MSCSASIIIRKITINGRMSSSSHFHSEYPSSLETKNIIYRLGPPGIIRKLVEGWTPVQRATKPKIKRKRTNSEGNGRRKRAKTNVLQFPVSKNIKGGDDETDLSGRRAGLLRLNNREVKVKRKAKCRVRYQV